jgi:hypothetical protein
MNVLAVYDESDNKTKKWAQEFCNLCIAEYDYEITVLSMSDYRVVPRSLIFLYCKNIDKLEKFVKKFLNDRRLASPKNTPLSQALLGVKAEDENDVYRLADGLSTVSIIGIADGSFTKPILSSALPSYIGDNYLLDKDSTIHKKMARCCLHVGVTPNLEIRESGYFSVNVHTLPDGELQQWKNCCIM